MEDSMTPPAKLVIDFGNPPTAYGYDGDGIFTQAELCSPDPLESELVGKAVWLLPANATFTAPPAAEAGKVSVWNGTTWELKEDNRGTKYWLPGDGWQTEPHEMKDLGPLPAGAMLDRPEKPLEQVKADKLLVIDAETSAAILAGFQCEATPPDTGQPELLHFSYDEFDQQNFADAAVSMQLAATSGGAIPTATPWNAYRGHTADSKGELVILELTASSFLPIYAAALQHKAAKMAEGGRRKAAVAAARTVEEVEAI